MKKVPVGDGSLKITPLAFESLGVRGMATYVETEDLKIIIDPGSALGPRFNLQPHEREYAALFESRERILDAAEEADYLSISHYHFDHFIPNFENWKYIWSSQEMAEDLYRDKVIFAKDISENINASQRKRGYMFRKKNLDISEEIIPADDYEFEKDETFLKFSTPVYHGPEETKLGYSLITTVKTSESTFVHAPDVQGPMYKESLDYLLSQEPDLLIVGGPPSYIDFKLDEEDLESSKKNLETLVREVPKLVVDHHLLRDIDYEDFLEPVKIAAEDSGNRLMVASEIMGEPPELLEARRKQLHEEEPMDDEWYEDLGEKESSKEKN